MSTEQSAIDTRWSDLAYTGPDGIRIRDLWPCHLKASRSTLKAT
jgi:hypothetical protein